MKVALLIGSSGLVSSHLKTYLKQRGYSIKILTRRILIEDTDIDSFYVWDPSLSSPQSLALLVPFLEDVDIILNFSGSSIAEGHLDDQHFAKIRESRLEPISYLIEALLLTPKKHRLWLQASAVGYYGDTQEDIITEETIVGKDPLSLFCLEWENSLLLNSAVKDYNIDVSILRLGIVFAKQAPAWNKMVTPIKMGFGGNLGNGEQWISWIHIHDLMEVVFFIISTKDSGIFNVTAPEPIKQKDFVKRIGAYCQKATFLDTPAFVLKLLFGKLAEYLLLSSCRALPNRLISKGFSFQYTNIDSAIENLISK